MLLFAFVVKFVVRFFLLPVMAVVAINGNITFLKILKSGAKNDRCSFNDYFCR